MSQPSFNPAAIIVTFHPDGESLARLVALLNPQVNKIFIVDNTPSVFEPAEKISANPRVSLIPLGRNLGVAAAHNRGIERARKAGFSHVLLMDQDSVPAADMARVLFSYLSELERKGLRIAAVGPLLIDARTNKPRGFLTTRSGRYVWIKNSATSWVPCDYLATSGSLMSMSALDTIGPMEEALFIDGVDIEWGYRAASTGSTCIGVFDTQLKHSKGERCFSILGFNQLQYTPVRHYYAFRNFCTLTHRNYISPAWKKHILLTTPLYALMLATIVAPRMKNLKMIIKGLSHGIRRRLGPIS